MLSIPKDIADETEKLITIARHEEFLALQFPDPSDSAAMIGMEGKALAGFYDQRAERLVQFVKGAKALEAMMRKYLVGGKREDDPSVESPAGPI